MNLKELWRARNRLSALQGQPWVAELAELRGTRELGIRKEELGISVVDSGWTVLASARSLVGRRLAHK